MSHSALRSYYLRRQGFYYSAVARGTAEERANFPFKHKRVAELVVNYQRRKTKRAWALYRYGSHGSAELAGQGVSEPDPFFDAFAATADASIEEAPLEVVFAKDDGRRRGFLDWYQSGGSGGAAPRTHAPLAATPATTDPEELRRRAEVAEAIAEERERSLTDIRAALSLAETLLRVEPSPDVDPDAPEPDPFRREGPPRDDRPPD